MKQLLVIFFLFLSLLCGCTTDADLSRMRSGLDSINQRNRNDQPFTVADVQPYADFFDRHGTSNDRLLAHYLLGRAYYEAGEAPMALQCYQQAAECADTTAEDCDYSQLCRVYAQMAETFNSQGLYRQQLAFDRLSERNAWKGGDTLAALMCYEQQSLAYIELGMVDSAIFIIEDVAAKYSWYGYPTNGIIALGSIIRTLTELGNYEKARKYMALYESKSGFFYEKGEIIDGREIYYYYKGLLCLKTGQMDSAHYWFHKELCNGKDFNNQNGAALGLAMLYKQLHMPDSAAKYYQYAYAMNDSVFARRATEDVERMQAMYDYSRFQAKAHQEEKKASQRLVVIWICVGSILLLCLVGGSIYESVNRKRREVENQYLNSLEIIRQARQDIAKLKAYKADTSELIAEKEQIIHEQKDFLSTLSKDSLVYKQFTIKGQEPTTEEWEQIEEQVFELYPNFHLFMEAHAKLLNEKERKTCILTRSGFRPKAISSMLSVGPSYISNIRSEMLQTLFNKTGSPKDFDKAIKSIF